MCISLADLRRRVVAVPEIFARRGAPRRRQTHLAELVRRRRDIKVGTEVVQDVARVAHLVRREPLEHARTRPLVRGRVLLALVGQICESRSRRLRERATRCRRASGLRKKVPLASGDDRAGYAYFSFFLVCYRPLASRLRLASAQTNDRIPRDMGQICSASHKHQRDLA